MLAIILPFLLIALICFWNFVWKRQGYPPGPIPLPIIGNTLPLMKGNQYLPLLQWKKQYGPIYTIWLGEDPTIMVNEYALMRELFVKDGDTFAGRDLMTNLFKNLDATKGGTGGIFFTDGEIWRVMRRFSMQSLRNLGMGKTKLEQQFLVDINDLIDKLRENLADSKDGIVDMWGEIDLLIGSFINRIVFGYAQKGPQQVEEFYKTRHLMQKHMELATTFRGQMITSLPILRHLPWFSTKFAEINANWSENLEILEVKIQKKVDAREKQIPDEPKDLIDYYLEQMDLAKQGKGEQEQQLKYFTRKNIPLLVGDILGAGQETTSTTLNFLLLYLLLDQRAQRKMQAELDGLDAEKGQNGFDNLVVTLADKPKLPFVNAVINESQRLCNLLPINLSHRTTCDVEIMGGKYKLAKGTTIIPQISCLLFDEQVFPNAQRFMPERFLDENGHLKKFDEMIPFGLGKRACIGESLARVEMFLFTANFFRIFNVFPEDALNPPSIEKEFDFSAHPKHFKCRLSLRKVDKLME